MGNRPSPERAMAVGALVPGVPAALLALLVGSLVTFGVGASAAIGVAAAVGGFCAQALALGWARHVSATAIQAVALSSFLILIGLVGGLYATLSTAPWFSAKAFGGGLLALIPVAFYEAHLTRRGRVAELLVDADQAATERSKGQA